MTRRDDTNQLRSVARQVLPQPVRARVGAAVGLSRVGVGATRLDLANRRAFGPRAPRYAERIWLDPLACNFAVAPGAVGRAHTGQVIDNDWDLQAHPVTSSVKVKAAELHWRDGVPWEETGVYEHMLELIEERGKADGCRTLEDVIARYKRLDVMFEQMVSEGRLRSRPELQKRGFRAKGEVYIHVGRGPQLLFGGGGCHRFAAARIAGLRSIPAQLGVVHAGALADWETVVVRSARRP